MTALYQSFAAKCWPEIRGAMPPPPSSTAKTTKKGRQDMPPENTGKSFQQNPRSAQESA